MATRYLVGHPGTGKSATLITILETLLDSGVRPNRILVLVPSETQTRRYHAAFAAAQMRIREAARPATRRSRSAKGGEPEIHTFFGLAQHHVGLFFPRIASRAGFADPHREPVWLNVEAAQYFLDRVLAARIADFADLRLPRLRLLVQILDDLNRAATTGFPLHELADRLASAWQGREPRAHLFQSVQDVALAYRQFCLDHSLVDFSLGMELFRTQLLTADFYREYVAARYRHVLADNVEEGAPLIHDFLELLLQTSDSAVLVEDDPGGYRINLGAEPSSARRLRAMCDRVDHVPDARVPEASPARFGEALMQAIRAHMPLEASRGEVRGDEGPVVIVQQPDRSPLRYWITMVQAVADRIGALVQSGVRAGDIAVVAPVVEDVLAFELTERLKRFGVAVQPVRPSHPLYDHPRVRAMVTLAKLAHPHWQAKIAPAELTRALTLSIADLDVVRAQIITDAVLRKMAGADIFALPILDDPAVWHRVGAPLRERYETLRCWLAQMDAGPPAPRHPLALDVFWQRLCAEVLSQPGFALHAPDDAGPGEDRMICDKLIASARAFHDVFRQSGLAPHAVPHVEPPVVEVPGLAPLPVDDAAVEVGLAYITVLIQGALAAQYAPERTSDDGADAVFLAPIYTYLADDHRSRYQFWLDVNATTWHERFYQPLTHPYVLSREWTPGTRWTDVDEQRMSRELLARLVGGLAFRCRDAIYLAAGELTMAGQEESGMLAHILNGLNDVLQL